MTEQTRREMIQKCFIGVPTALVLGGSAEAAVVGLPVEVPLSPSVAAAAVRKLERIKKLLMFSCHVHSGMEDYREAYKAEAHGEDAWELERLLDEPIWDLDWRMSSTLNLYPGPGHSYDANGVEAGEHLPEIGQYGGQACNTQTGDVLILYIPQGREPYTEIHRFAAPLKFVPLDKDA